MKEVNVYEIPAGLRAGGLMSRLDRWKGKDIWVSAAELAEPGYSACPELAMALMSCYEFHREMEGRLLEEIERYGGLLLTMEGRRGRTVTREHREEALEVVEDLKFMCDRLELEDLELAKSQSDDAGHESWMYAILDFAIHKARQYVYAMESILRMPQSGAIGYYGVVKPVFGVFLDEVCGNVGGGFYMNPATMEVMAVTEKM